MKLDERLVTGQMDRSISEMLVLASQCSEQRDVIVERTLRRHAERMIQAGQKILRMMEHSVDELMVCPDGSIREVEGSLLEPRVSTQREPDSRRRSKFEVRMSILRAVVEGNKAPTQVMYRANTSWGILQRELSILEKTSLIRVAPAGESSERLFYQQTPFASILIGTYDELTRAVGLGPRMLQRDAVDERARTLRQRSFRTFLTEPERATADLPNC